jgi:hypothetical protein
MMKIMMKMRSLLRSDMHFWNLTSVSGIAFSSMMLSSPSLIFHVQRYDLSPFLFFILISERINPRTHHGFSLLLLLSNVSHQQMSISYSNPPILSVTT